MPHNPKPRIITVLAAAATAAHLAAVTASVGAVTAVVSDRPFAAVAGASVAAAGCLAAWLTSLLRLRACLTAASRDALTGLPGRAATDQMLRETSRRNRDLTVALADVDGLHAVNTNFGHAAGDQYLTAVADRLARAVPPGGLLTRHGGDEFVILAPGIHPQDLAAAIGAAMGGPAVIAGHRLQPHASVGIATTYGGDARHALACADTAMYRAKQAGGNHTCVYDPDRDPTPNLDGTRPLLRRRDIDPARAGAVLWEPTPRDDLLAILFTVADTRLLHQALCAARDRCTEAGFAAQAGADRPPRPRSAHLDHVDLEPTPAGYRAIAGISAEQAAGYARLADRVAAIIDAAETTRPTASAAATAGADAVSAAFTADEVETLVRTAAEAVYGDPDGLSARQRTLAAHAYWLLRDWTDHATTPGTGHTQIDKGVD